VDLKVGDIVARKSYNNDILFKVENIVTSDTGEMRVELRGIDVRLLADSPLEDLTRPDIKYVREYRKRFIRQNNECLKRIFSRRIKDREHNSSRAVENSPEDFFEMPGRVLHIDGNEEYLNLCLALYTQLNIKAKGVHVPEKEQPASVPVLIRKYSPDIIVLTGHDGIKNSKEDFSDLTNYYNSRYFVESVKAARNLECSRDNLVIFAGACQSHYEALLESGANYASSPLRVFIHAFDPVFIVEKVAFTTINRTVVTSEAIDSTITGTDGIGGIETRGKYRRGYPKSPY